MVGTVNAAPEHFQAGVADLALAEARFPGWLARLLTHPVKGLDNFAEAFQLLSGDTSPIKVFIDVAEFDV